MFCRNCLTDHLREESCNHLLYCAVCCKETADPVEGLLDGKKVPVCRPCFAYETGGETPTPFTPEREAEPKA